MRSPPASVSKLFPYTTLFRSVAGDVLESQSFISGIEERKGSIGEMLITTTKTEYKRKSDGKVVAVMTGTTLPSDLRDRKSTRLNSSHSQISYAVFCLKKKNKT